MEIRLSSHKRDHGLRELLSRDINEYWATDDILPHVLQVSFNKLTYVEEVRMYLSFTQDDSYTPQDIEIRAGIFENKLNTLNCIQLTEPEGSHSLSIKQECFFIQVIILSNHQEGKDSHIRHLKIMSTKNKEMYIPY